MKGEEEGLLGVGSEGVMKGSIVMGVFKRDLDLECLMRNKNYSCERVSRVLFF